MSFKLRSEEIRNQPNKNNNKINIGFFIGICILPLINESTKTITVDNKKKITHESILNSPNARIPS